MPKFTIPLECCQAYFGILGIIDIRGGKPIYTHPQMQILNPSTSAKPFMTKLQNLFPAFVNMDIFQMTLKLTFFTVDYQVQFLLKHCKYIFVYAECLQVYAVSAPLEFLLNFP